MEIKEIRSYNIAKNFPTFEAINRKFPLCREIESEEKDYIAYMNVGDPEWEGREWIQGLDRVKIQTKKQIQGLYVAKIQNKYKAYMWLKYKTRPICG